MHGARTLVQAMRACVARAVCLAATMTWFCRAWSSHLAATFLRERERESYIRRERERELELHWEREREREGQIVLSIATFLRERERRAIVLSIETFLRGRERERES